MPTRHDLVEAAKAPELQFRKRAIVAASLLLVVLGVIAIISTPSHKKGSDGVFLFRRTLQFFQSKGGSGASPGTLSCPCWAPSALDGINVTNLWISGSCDGVDDYVKLQIEESVSDIEGGFGAAPALCATRNLAPYHVNIAYDESVICAQQIAFRCAELGQPIDIRDFGFG
jgi:hypothetical protein